MPENYEPNPVGTEMPRPSAPAAQVRSDTFDSPYDELDRGALDSPVDPLTQLAVKAVEIVYGSRRPVALRGPLRAIIGEIATWARKPGPLQHMAKKTLAGVLKLVYANRSGDGNINQIDIVVKNDVIFGLFIELAEPDSPMSTNDPTPSSAPEEEKPLITRQEIDAAVQDTAELQQPVVTRFQKLLDDLKGRRAATPEENKWVASVVRELADKRGIELVANDKPIYFRWTSGVYEAAARNRSRLPIVPSDADFPSITARLR